MPVVTIVYGLVLAALGVGFYFGLAPISVTALIPAFFAIPVLLCGFLARSPGLRKHAMHAAAMLGVLGVLGGAPGAIKLVKSLAGSELARPAAAVEQAVMALVSLVFVVLCVRSFVAARRARAGQG
jgi:hypothetical protein